MAIRRWTDEQLVEGCKQSMAIGEVMQFLGLKPGSGNEANVRRHIARLELDTSHFFNSTNYWKGKKGEKSSRWRQESEVFKRGVPYNTNIKRRFLNTVKYVCSQCGINDWNKFSLTLQIDHIDGETTNNAITNLRLLCPNCHSQTPTFGKNKIYR